MKQRSSALKEIARERITTLFQQAQETFPEHPQLAHRYVELARKIAMKVNGRLPPQYKRKFCKYCYHFLMPGFNARIRTREGKVVITCWDCRKITRIPFTKRKKN